jgi:hypothetical protein
VEVLFAAPLINLSNDFLPGRRREANGPHRYIARPFVMPRGPPGQFLVESAVVVVVGEVAQLNPEEVGQRSHGGLGGIVRAPERNCDR